MSEAATSGSQEDGQRVDWNGEEDCLSLCNTLNPLVCTNVVFVFILCLMCYTMCYLLVFLCRHCSSLLY